MEVVVTALRSGWAAQLHHHWFHVLRPADWFGHSDAVDAELRRRFARTHATLRGQAPGRFLDGPRGTLAAVLLFDQVPRNIHRGSGQAFATDPLARALTRAALRRGWDEALTPAERQFLLMPLMHGEAIRDQCLSLVLFARLPRRQGWDFARAHYRMIARFGRFPHRNAVLGRTSTAAETRAVEEGNAW